MSSEEMSDNGRRVVLGECDNRCIHCDEPEGGQHGAECYWLKYKGNEGDAAAAKRAAIDRVIIEGAAHAAGQTVAEWTAEACDEKLTRLGVAAFNRDEIGRAYMAALLLRAAYEGGLQEAVIEGFQYADRRLAELRAKRGGR